MLTFKLETVKSRSWKQPIFYISGVLHLMETGDVQKKDLIEHPENYILLTTLDEGEVLYHFATFLFIQLWC